LTEKVLPAIVSVPDRMSPWLASTLNCTLPLPDPDAPPVIVTQPTPLEAVHVQVKADAVTATVPLPPVASNVWLSGEIENVHGGGGAAACDTLKV